MNRRYRVKGLYLWLALLTFLAVFAATAGARETLASRTQAARQTLAATTLTSRTITAWAAWNDARNVLSFDSNAIANTSIVPPTTINAITGQLHAAFNHAPVTLAPTGSATPVPSAAADNGNPAAGRPAATLQVVMTRQTAATLGLDVYPVIRACLIVVV